MSKEIKLVLTDDAYKAIVRALRTAWLTQSESPLTPLWADVIEAIDDGQEVFEVKTKKDKEREASQA